jgi:hypothetical protein
LPVFHHDEEDVQSYRMFTSQMVVNGTVKANEILKWQISIGRTPDHRLRQPQFVLPEAFQ